MNGPQTEREPDNQTRTLRSSELARLAGVSTDTLRYYERKRLLPAPPRTASGYRCYPPGSLARVELIRRALRLGFSTEELARILKVRDSGGAPCKMVRTLAGEKLHQVEEQMKELARFRRQLNSILRDWDERLSGAGNGQVRLLEAVEAPAEHPRSFPAKRVKR